MCELHLSPGGLGVTTSMKHSTGNRMENVILRTLTKKVLKGSMETCWGDLSCCSKEAQKQAALG